MNYSTSPETGARLLVVIVAGCCAAVLLTLSAPDSDPAGQRTRSAPPPPSAKPGLHPSTTQRVPHPAPLIAGSDVSTRHAAVLAWQEQPGVGASELLKAALEDSDPEIRGSAVYALARKEGRNPEVDEALSKRFPSEPDPRVRKAVLITLATRANACATRTLLDALYADSDPLVRRMAVDLLPLEPDDFLDGALATAKALERDSMVRDGIEAARARLEGISPPPPSCVRPRRNP